MFNAGIQYQCFYRGTPNGVDDHLLSQMNELFVIRYLLPWKKPRSLSRFLVSGRSFSDCKKNSYDYTHLLQTCRSIKCVKKLHSQIIVGGFEQNPFVATKLVGKYTDCGPSSMELARKLFDKMSERDVFIWNVVIQGYANLGPVEESINLFNEMRLNGVSQNRYTYPFVLKACGGLKDKKKGQAIHGHVFKFGFESDLFVENALVSFYAKCKELELARRVFDGISQKDVVSWNSMISGYSANCYNNEALTLFIAMVNHQAIISPDHATLVVVLPACGETSAIEVGFWIHSFIVKSRLEIDTLLGSSLISMYGNCGRVKMARKVFDGARDKNIVVWSAMIRCYGIHGEADKALEMFDSLIESNLSPDGIIFLSLLSTCSHAGMVEKGSELYEKMEDYGVEKGEEHYACMVDLFGRAGLLDQAVEFIRNMPVEAGKNVYGALLGACRKHDNMELAEEVTEKLFVLDPENAGRYLILVKMYEDKGKWDEAARVRKLLKDKEIKKPMGCSSIEVDGRYHTFSAEDESHPLKEQIFGTLERLESAMAEQNEVAFHG